MAQQQGLLTWRVQLVDSKPFTMLTDQAKTIEEVKKAVLEKFCRPAVKVERI